MKRRFALLIILSPLLFLARPASAVYWDPITHEIMKTYGSNCILTPDPAQKSTTTVYTLDIAKTQAINSSYYSYWRRWARCDELQYHAENSTSLEKLKAWLLRVEKTRLRKHQYQGAIRSTDGKIWLVVNDTRSRIYDWPTMAAWGLLSADVHSLSRHLNATFLAAYKEVGTATFDDSPYGSYIQDVRNTFVAKIGTTVSTQAGIVPESLKQEVATYGLSGQYGFFRFRNPCYIGFNQRSWICSDLDESFALTNSCWVMGSSYACDDGREGELNEFP